MIDKIGEHVAGLVVPPEIINTNDWWKALQGIRGLCDEALTERGVFDPETDSDAEPGKAGEP